MSRLLALVFLAVILPLPMSAQSDDIDRYVDIDGLKRELSQRPLRSVEGIWKFPCNGAMVLIESVTDAPRFDGADTYRMVILRSPSRSLLPGTVMGTLTGTSEKGIYAASLFTDSDGGSRLFKAKSFTLTLSGDSRISFKRRGKKLSFQIWRMIPYLSRLYVRTTGGDVSNEDGCVKVFPVSADGPIEPVYL